MNKKSQGEFKITYTLEEVSKFKLSDYIFYENINNTYELKNASKTRICAYCGKRIKTEQIDAEHIVYKCDCNDFLDNCNKEEELSRKKLEILNAKLSDHYKDFIKEKNYEDSTLTKLQYKKEVLLFCIKHNN